MTPPSCAASASPIGVSAATSSMPRAVVSGGAGFIGSHLCEALLAGGTRVLALGNVNPIGPRGCYDEAKRCAEAFAMAYHRAHGVDTRIIRIFNTHGPRMQVLDGRAVPNFMAQAIRGEPLTVYGDGSQTRSLCYVSDLVRGILAAIDKGDDQPVNLGNPEEVTVLELAQIIVRLAGSSSPIEFRSLPVDDPKQRRPDITRAGKLLGWQPEVALEDGLSRTLEYFRRVA